MKTIIILVGIPCSGKSTWSYSDDSPTIAIVSRDMIRETSFKQPYKYTTINEQLVTKVFNTLLSSYLSKEDVTILDNTHCKEKYIDEIINKYSKEYFIKIKYFDIPLWKAHYRNIIRYLSTNKGIPISVINNMYKNYNKINRKKYEQYNIQG